LRNADGFAANPQMTTRRFPPLWSVESHARRRRIGGVFGTNDQSDDGSFFICQICRVKRKSSNRPSFHHQPEAQHQTLRGGLRRISPSCPSFCTSRSRLIRMATRGPSRRMWFPRRLVHGIGSAGPANPAHGGHALFNRCPPAIFGTAAAHSSKIVIGAPRIGLRRSGFFKADDNRENTQDE
jgi:hypothetical protein